MRIRMSSIFTVVLLFLFFTHLLFPERTLAGTTGKISGTVLDASSGEGLFGANVFIEGVAMGAATDEEGFFFILNIPPGTYSVTVSYVGYEKVLKSSVLVMIDRTTNLDFSLNPSRIELESVMVVSERPIVDKDVTGSQSTLDANQISRAPVADLKDVMRQQSGVINTGETTFIRGGMASELNYQLDGTSLNSGIISDNYQRLNLTSVQEISVLTGGYNAEYGQAMSGVVNVVTKESSGIDREVHGTIKYRMRPAGKYHWGRNMYDESLLKSTYYNNLDYWEGRLEGAANARSMAKYYERWYGPGTTTNDPYWDGVNTPTAEQLRGTYKQQITPSDDLKNYAEQVEHEIEGSIYGSPLNNLSILLSGRYKKGVNIYPQADPFNPEYNVQGKISYNLESGKKLSLNVLHGWYKSNSFTESNWNNMETSQEARWQPNAEVRHPYWEDTAYGPSGGTWQKGPQEKNFNMASLSWHHTLSPSTFYTIQASFLSDYMTELQDYSKLSTDLSTMGWGDSWYDLTGNYRLESRQVRLGNYSDSKVYSLTADLTSQVTRSHMIKAGLEFKAYDLDYQHYWFEFPAGDIWHLDNVFSGKPIEFAAYIQDKIEYEGITLNLGFRFDAFDSNRDYAESIYDPLAFQEWNGGDGSNPSNTGSIWQADRVAPEWWLQDSTFNADYRSSFPDSVRNNKNTVESELKFAFAPRIGISFPITDNSKLRFNYGHFYQRPSWSKVLGHPTSWYESNPYGSVRMDQWMGWYGQPGLTYERTIQYELGFTQNIYDIVRLDIVGYYKDASNLTRFSYSGNYNTSGGYAQTWTESPVTFSTSRNMANDGHDNIFYTNNAYRDIRGAEITVDKVFSNHWAANVTFNYSMTTGGASGYWQYREDEETVHQPWGYDEVKLDWISSYILRGSLSYVTPNDWGVILGDWTASIYYEYFAGPEYTYYPEEYTGLQFPNNKRWFPHQKADLKFNKRFPLGDVTPIIGIEIYNVFNNYDRNMLDGDDLEQFEENGRMPQAREIDGQTEDDVWWFYNSISNPMRMIYLTLGLEF
jgi:hypothetical protein